MLGGVGMEDVFKNMEEEKKDRIINAAIDEFANFPYEKASTNNIVKNAGISKGLLFHYFANKQELYEKIIEFVLNKLVDEVAKAIDWQQTDILLRIKQAIIMKMNLSKVYPNMFEFIIKMISEKGAKDTKEIMELYEKYGIDVNTMLLDVYTKNIDFSKFKDQGSIEKSINIVRWTMEKYAEEQLITCGDIDNLDFEKYVKDIDGYVDVFKKAFY